MRIAALMVAVTLFLIELQVSYFLLALYGILAVDVSGLVRVKRLNLFVLRLDQFELGGGRIHN